MTTAERPPFDPQAFLAKTNGGGGLSSFKSNHIIYSQGNEADSVFYVHSGKAKVVVLSEQGKEAVISIVGPGAFFGEGFLVGQVRRLATVTALVDCSIARIAMPNIIRVIREEPAFAEFFIAHLLNRNARVEEDLVDQLFNSSEKRLARILLLLANCGKDTPPEPTLAEMVGTTRSRVSIFMNKFRQLGFINYNGHIEVHASLLNVLLRDKQNSERMSDIDREDS